MMRSLILAASVLVVGLMVGGAAEGQGRYELLIRGGHVIDAKNGIDGVRDVAITGGRIAAVGEGLDEALADRVVDAGGLYVVPGLIDLHVHVYAGTGDRNSYAGDNAVYPDGFTFRAGVTTVVDAGGAGWRNFEDFRDRVIERSETRVLALLNIVGHGMRGEGYENNLDDMLVEPAVAMAKKHEGLIVGIKTAHYGGPEWTPVERAVETGEGADLPVMVDYGTDYPEERPLEELLREKLRGGDIYTHCFSGNRRELLEDGRPNPGLGEGQERGVVLDIGHGGGSFSWRVAEAAMAAGIKPDTISSDLHIGSMNGGMKDLLNVTSKLLIAGMSLEEVIEAVTWKPAMVIGREDLGHLSVGAVADVAVLRMVEGEFGYVDSFGYRRDGDRRLVCEMTLRDGEVVWDLNGISRPDWREDTGE